MNLRGLSHIEFVVSFAVFLGFIVFAFIFFNPLESNRTLKSSLDYAWIEVSREVMRDAEIYSVSINETILEDIVEIDIDNIPINYNTTIEDSDGNLVSSYKNGADVIFKRNGENFFRIIYSSALLNSTPLDSGRTLGEGDYYVSSSESKELYFERLFSELNRSYFSNYTALKKKMNLPNRIEFGFIVDFNEYKIQAVNNIPDGFEVMSRSDRVELIRNSGRREYAELKVLVW